ncbi:hypothetical protein ACEQ8H_007798 [Pleosporales sp. CAS-2024a]
MARLSVEHYRANANMTPDHVRKTSRIRDMFKHRPSNAKSPSGSLAGSPPTKTALSPLVAPISPTVRPGFDQVGLLPSERDPIIDVKKALESNGGTRVAEVLAKHVAGLEDVSAPHSLDTGMNTTSANQAINAAQTSHPGTQSGNNAKAQAPQNHVCPVKSHEEINAAADILSMTKNESSDSFTDTHDHIERHGHPSSPLVLTLRIQLKQSPALANRPLALGSPKLFGVDRSICNVDVTNPVLSLVSQLLVVALYTWIAIGLLLKGPAEMFGAVFAVSMGLIAYAGLMQSRTTAVHADDLLFAPLHYFYDMVARKTCEVARVATYRMVNMLVDAVRDNLDIGASIQDM